MKLLVKIFLVLIISFLVFTVKAQSQNQIISIEGQNVYGGDRFDNLVEVLILPDGSRILGGESRSSASGDKSENTSGEPDFWIVRTDAQGNLLWEKTFGTKEWNSIKSMILLPDGSFLLGSTSSSNRSGDKTQDSKGKRDYWIIRIDKNGTILWDKVFGGNEDDKLVSLSLLDDGNILLAGNSNSGISGDKSEELIGSTDVWLVKIDMEGKKISDKSVGWSQRNVLEQLLILPDGNLLLNMANGLTKTNLDGEAIWHSSSINGGKKMISLEDGNFLIGGTTRFRADPTNRIRGTDYNIIKFDSNGKALWSSIFGGYNFGTYENTTDVLTSMLYLPDGSILLGGSSSSNKSGEKSHDSRGSLDFWLVNAKNQSSRFIWEKINWNKTIGGSSSDQLKDIDLLPNGNYLLSGLSGSNISGEKTENSKGGADYWTVEIKYYDTNDFNTLEALLVELPNSKIKTLKSGDIIDPEAIGNDLFGIQIFAKEPYPESKHVQSMEIKLTGPINVQKIENLKPYTLFGEEKNGILKGERFPEGSYQLTATAYSQKNANGIIRDTLTINFTVKNQITSQRENEFILINATIDQDSKVLKNGDIIKLHNVGDKWNIRVKPADDKVGSVLMELTSNTGLNHTQIENQVPFALFGEEPGTYNYFGKVLLPGEYKLKVTFYEKPNLKGAIGQTEELSFSVQKKVIHQAYLVDVSTGEDIGPLTQNLSIPCGTQFSVRAVTNEPVGSLQFILKNPSGEINRIENLSPYTLLGEDISGKLIPLKSLSGEYQLTIVPFTQKNGQGIQNLSQSYVFSAEGDDLLNSITVVDAANNQTITTLQNQSTIINPEGGLSFIANTGECVEKVQFVVKKEVLKDGINIYPGVLVRTEKQTPYTLSGELANGDYIPWHPEPGNYILEVSTFGSDNTDAPLLKTHNYKFTIIDHNTTKQIKNDAVVGIFPNPSDQDLVYLDLDLDLNAPAQLALMDKQGKVLISKTIQNKDITLDVNTLEPGYYILQIQTTQQVFKRVLIIN